MNRAPLLADDAPLPAPETANYEGLVAVGGGLSVERLGEAYSKGIFPWSAPPPTWWSPDPRALLELDGLRVSRRLRQKIRQGRFRVTFNADFEAVIRACASQHRPGESTWISPALIDAYVRFHHAGRAHSIEAWDEDGDLAGGVYGVATGAMFAGESMFHRATDASKVALHALIERLREREFAVFDAQVLNPFTEQMGARDVRRAVFLARLRAAVELERTFP